MEQHELFELERRITYLEKYIDELNDVVIEQGRALSKLSLELQTMRDKSENSPVDPARAGNEKPPHY